MRKIILFLILAFALASCDESGDKKIKVSNSTNTSTSTQSVDETKKKELELKEKELEQKEKELMQEKELQKERELSERERQIAEKDRELAEKEQRLKEKQNTTVTPPRTTNRKNYSGYPGKYPEGSSRNLTLDDIVYKSKWQLKIMRNEIYARHGYIFQTNDMRNYFNKQSWYYPQYYNVEGMLSDVERSNISMIKSYE